MHELSLCAAIADTVIDHAGDRAVERIRLRIGHFRQVVPETLHHCWSMRSADTPLAATELEIEHVPATIRCDACGEVTELAEPILRCGSCGAMATELRSGDELLVVSIDLAPQAVR